LLFIKSFHGFYEALSSFYYKNIGISPSRNDSEIEINREKKGGKETVTHFPLTVNYSRRAMRENLLLSALFRHPLSVPFGLPVKLQLST
jgi:hypothetical protein